MPSILQSLTTRCLSSLTAAIDEKRYLTGPLCDRVLQRLLQTTAHDVRNVLMKRRHEGDVPEPSSASDTIDIAKPKKEKKKEKENNANGEIEEGEKAKKDKKNKKKESKDGDSDAKKEKKDKKNKQSNREKKDKEGSAGKNKGDAQEKSPSSAEASQQTNVDIMAQAAGLLLNSKGGPLPTVSELLKSLRSVANRPLTPGEKVQVEVLRTSTRDVFLKENELHKREHATQRARRHTEWSCWGSLSRQNTEKTLCVKEAITQLISPSHHHHPGKEQPMASWESSTVEEAEVIDLCVDYILEDLLVDTARWLQTLS